MLLSLFICLSYVFFFFFFFFSSRRRHTRLQGDWSSDVCSSDLDSMIPAMAVAGAAKSPVRLGFVYHPVGMILNQWMPTAEGTGFEFTPTMKALEPFREHLTVFTGLAQVNGRAL